MELDVSKLPTQMPYGPEKREVNLASVVLQAQSAINALAAAGLVKSNASFGFAIAKPSMDLAQWDDPYALTWFVGGWGPERNRNIANAVRKMRPAARERTDTLELRYSHEMRFINIVESQEPDGTFTWGDYPWGGAVTISFGGLRLLGAVSCLTEEEDQAAASLLLNLIAVLMFKTDSASAE